MPGLIQPVLAPPSVDMVRVIRRSMRCFVFGCIGFIPVLGLGLAVQAVRLRRSIFAELGSEPRTPPVYWLWALAVLVLWNADGPLGLAGDSVILCALFAVQCWWFFRQSPPESKAHWNPGHWHVFWGAALAYGGILNSLALAAIFIARLSSADW